MAMSKDMKKVIKSAQRRGWVFEHGRVHNKLIHPSGRKVAVSSTSSDGMAHHNVQRDVARVEAESDAEGVTR